MPKKKVLIQMGHISPRDPSHETETGANGEQELVRKIGLALQRRLKADPAFEVVLVPGKIPPVSGVDAAIFLHGDGSANEATRGYSYGYPQFEVNKRLRHLLSAEYKKLPGHPPFFRDNYTAGLRGYYGYGRVQTAGPEVLVEHGFLSNPQDRAWMFDNVENIAKAHHRALRRYFGLSADQQAPVPSQKGYVVSFYRKNGSLFKERTAKWPRIAIVSVDLAANDVTRIDIRKL